MSQISFDPQAVGWDARNMKGAYMRGPGGRNALPSVMRSEAEREAGEETFGFSNVQSNPMSSDTQFTENVDAGAI